MADSPRFCIGVDLGTTNIVVAFVDSDEGAEARPRIFPIPQLTGPGQLDSLPMLPALRYHYGGDLNPEQTRLPWQGDTVNAQLPDAVIGRWAHELGSKTPARLLASAKSWLSYRSESHGEILLPQSETGDLDDGIGRCSPMDATASFLAYVQAAWNHAHPNAHFHEQDLVITVPASFDDMARALTVEAIRRIGVDRFKLLEEPQAACYHWLAGNEVAALRSWKTLAVCDVGGGTSDFTLIAISPDSDEGIKLERVGVGEHLMLGGDNMDLALAAKAQQKLGQKITHAELLKLLPQCQAAKERMLASDAPEAVNLTLAGAGSGLMAGIKQTRLTRPETEQLLLDGFFPLVDNNARPKTRRAALSEVGLPYPADAAISRHIAAFLQEHQALLPENSDEDGIRVPDVWLLNGGPFLAEKIRQRLQTQIGRWSSRELLWLSNEEPQTAVAFGAAHYASSLRQRQPLIDSAVVRHYFVRVASSSGDQAVCVLPKNTPLHTPLLSTETYQLKRGQDVQFEVASSLEDRDYKLGESQPWNEKLHLLPPLQSRIEGSGTVPVKLACELDELGVLQLSLHAESGDEEWHLQFNLRKEQAVVEEIVDHRLAAALELIEQWYGTAASKPPKLPLKKGLEKCLGAREQWTGAQARALFDRLTSLAKKRKRSAQHERGFFNIAGYCLRPGIGFNGDIERVKQAWSLFEQGIQHQQQADIWAQWWAFWRRAAAGLDAQQQLVLYTDINHVLQTGKRVSSKNPKLVHANEEKLRLLGSLERLPADLREQTAKKLMKQVLTGKADAASCWCAARLLNRKPVYAEADSALPAATVGPWLHELLALDWQKQGDLAFIAVFGARSTDTDAMEIDPDLLRELKGKLTGKLSRLADSLDTHHQLADNEVQKLWGDVLPSGLSL